MVHGRFNWQNRQVYIKRFEVLGSNPGHVTILTYNRRKYVNKHKIILIVEDEESVSVFLSEVLEMLELSIDVEIISVENVEKAMKQINKLDVNLIFLDLNLPDKFGLYIYEEVRKVNKSLLFIFMSGYPLPEIIDDPNVYFLPKPFLYEDIELLMNKIKLKW